MGFSPREATVTPDACLLTAEAWHLPIYRSLVRHLPKDVAGQNQIGVFL
jgi:hypothetical protein